MVIRRDDPARPELRRLVEALDAYAQALYPPESNHLLDIETMRLPQMRFFSVAVDGETVGCGGIWLHDDCAEVKRVYVSPRARGMGLARKLMARLEAEALAAGKAMARLETGIHQPEALSLYRALGYVNCGAFADYPVGDHNSVFMEKLLAGPAE
ncbi:MAG: GNAT family N-acetyltransferase [Rhizobiales bacterium]|nr:GNAT family N-acetyltransferase [Hyphomicrobiales bacterium]MBI3673723.1 GNAT family N-acetyltransferase [Hyphomicrobiales bacterium]